MRKAYLITAYMDVEQLARLVKALDENSDFYLHIDRKMEEAPFRSLVQGKNIFWVKDREWISWGGISQVYCLKKLLRDMAESGRKYDRVICLSGTDYPVWSNEELDREFAEHPRRQYVCGYNISHTQKETAKRRCDRHWSMETHIRNRTFQAAVRKVKNKVLNQIPMRRQAPLQAGEGDLYWGSDYWAVTYDCALYLYRGLCEEKEFIRYLRRCYVPSELVVQTLLFHSEFGRDAVLLDEATDFSFTLATPLQHLIWDGDDIRVMTERDLEGILKSGRPFFRKAYSGVSDGLIRLLEERKG